MNELAQGYPGELEAFPLKPHIERTLSFSRNNPVNNRPTVVGDAIRRSTMNVLKDIAYTIDGFANPGKGGYRDILKSYSIPQVGRDFINTVIGVGQGGVNVGINTINGIANMLLSPRKSATNLFNAVKYLNSAPGSVAPSMQKLPVNIPTLDYNIPGSTPGTGDIGQFTGTLLAPKLINTAAGGASKSWQSILNKRRAFNARMLATYGLPGGRTRLGRRNWRRHIGKLVKGIDDDKNIYDVLNDVYDYAVPKDLVLRGIIPASNGDNFYPLLKSKPGIYRRYVSGGNAWATGANTPTFAGIADRGRDVVDYPRAVVLMNGNNIMRKGSGKPLITLDSRDPKIINPIPGRVLPSTGSPREYWDRLAQANRTPESSLVKYLDEYGEVVRVPQPAHTYRGRGVRSDDITDIAVGGLLKDGTPAHFVFGRSGQPSGIDPNTNWLRNPKFMFRDRPELKPQTRLEGDRYKYYRMPEHKH